MPDKAYIGNEVQKIVAKVSGRLPASQILPSHRLRMPHPPIGMDDTTLKQMIPLLNTLIRYYNSNAGITATELLKLDQVVDLKILVWKKVR